TEDVTTNTNTIAFRRDNLLDDGQAQDNLIGGGAYYVSNPAPTYELDPELIYFDAEWQEGRVELLDGDVYRADLRYRVLDQKFEVLVEGEAYELDNNQIARVDIADAYFILMVDPLNRLNGRHIHQLHFIGGDMQILEQHEADWQDPPEQNMFDTREQHRTVKRTSTTVFGQDGQFNVLRNNRSLTRLLGLAKGSDAMDFVRSRRLQLKEAADAARLLSFLVSEQ
ncbi:MAG: hypothetical protein AAFR97_14265, partial [Bacteroidota bacterium]